MIGRGLFAVLFAACLATAAGVPAEEIKKGLMRNYPIDTKLYQKSEDYFENRIPDKMRDAYEDGDVPSNWTGVNSKTPTECIEYNQADASMVVYVPESYDGSKAFGMYVHNSPGNGGISPSGGWQKLMNEKGLIYISPNKTKNGTPTWHRIVRALDGLATIKKHYKIDDNRVYVGGLSGGGHTGMLCQMLYPEHFHGAISHAAQSYLPRSGSCGHFPGLSSSDARKSPRKDRKWCVISGDKDFNYEKIKETSEIWEDRGYKYRFFDIEGMGHNNAAAEALRSAIEWIEEGSPSRTGAMPGAVAAASPSEIRTWTSSRGDTLEARLVRDEITRVVLETADGRKMRIRTDQLSEEDRQFIRNIKLGRMRNN